MGKQNEYEGHIVVTLTIAPLPYILLSPIVFDILFGLIKCSKFFVE